MAAHAIERVGIVGSGIMGSGIAEVAAKAGYEVVLRSRKQATADAMVASLEKSLDKQVERGKLDADEATAVLGRVSATDHLGALADCDLVIESVVEDLEVKRLLFDELDSVCQGRGHPGHQHLDPAGHRDGRRHRSPRAGRAACTSSTRRRRCRWSRSSRPLTADDETIEAVTAFAAACGKNPVEVKDRAGFIVNALLFPYLNNAVRMLETGTATADDIDAAMKGGCNFPMGPLALFDLVGPRHLGRRSSTRSTRSSTIPNYAAVPVLRRMVTAGQLGRKSGEGFYDYAR